MDSSLLQKVGPKVLVISSRADFQGQVAAVLGEFCEIQPVQSPAEALGLLATTSPDLVLLAQSAASSVPFAAEHLMRSILELHPSMKILLVAEAGACGFGPCALATGAWDFLESPVDEHELRFLVKRACRLSKSQPSNQPADPLISNGSFEGMLGSCPAMQALFGALQRVAASDASVVLLGETGTGKEMAARAIHARSVRRQGPFVAINCSAIPAALAESELFGHERGSFTGAHRLRQGRIEQAAGGTLFLDEIGELSPLLQSKLLRFLQERTIERVGGRRPFGVDARVISATHVDLQRALLEKRFREDLYYRLAVVTIRLPPLRERQADVHRLAALFLRRESLKAGRAAVHFSKAASRSLERHAWPGNVRELENRVRRAVIMGASNCLEPLDLELEEARFGNSHSSLRVAREAVERELVERALRKHLGKIAPAAAELQVSRPTFYDLMERLQIGRGRDS
ncbi:MAG TPA: sigma-54 dependent transcriptional regulator [Verrucomicrobiae bacterium]|nr:sigma-54 dependent transcriptional regulator [Verrucomicrobiae bacterium]